MLAVRKCVWALIAAVKKTHSDQAPFLLPLSTGKDQSTESAHQGCDAFLLHSVLSLSFVAVSLRRFQVWLLSITCF